MPAGLGEGDLVIMPNFDVAAGINQAKLNDLLGQYFSNAPASNNPFKGSTTKPVQGLGNVTLTWNVERPPTIVFGPPSLDVWNPALNAQGQTNGDTKTPLPTLPMVQVTLPVLTASYRLGSVEVGGTANNVVAYATLTFAPGTITIGLVAVTLDESSFSTWDKAIFNLVLLPQIFSSAKDMLSVVHIPSIGWQDVQLNPLQLQMVGDQLIAAATLVANKQPLDTSGVTWPTDPVFALASTGLVNTALTDFLAPFQGKTFADSGDFHGLANWDYSGSVSSLSATVKTVAPLTIDARASASLTAGAKLTAAGMALAAAGCALGAALI